MSARMKEHIENTIGQIMGDLLENENQRGIWLEVERLLIKRALEKTEGNQVKASNLLGISRNTLRKRMERYKIYKEIKIVKKGA